MLAMSFIINSFSKYNKKPRRVNNEKRDGEILLMETCAYRIQIEQLPIAKCLLQYSIIFIYTPRDTHTVI